MPRGYLRNFGWAIIVVVSAVGYLAGVRGWALVFGVTVGFVPAGMVMWSIARRLWPPPLEVADANWPFPHTTTLGDS